MKIRTKFISSMSKTCAKGSSVNIVSRLYPELLGKWLSISVKERDFLRRFQTGSETHPASSPKST
jgi:hypothetical protein